MPTALSRGTYLASAERGLYGELSGVTSQLVSMARGVEGPSLMSLCTEKHRDWDEPAGDGGTISTSAGFVVAAGMAAAGVVFVGPGGYASVRSLRPLPTLHALMDAASHASWRGTVGAGDRGVASRGVSAHSAAAATSAGCGGPASRWRRIGVRAAASAALEGAAGVRSWRGGRGGEAHGSTDGGRFLGFWGLEAFWYASVAVAASDRKRARPGLMLKPLLQSLRASSLSSAAISSAFATLRATIDTRRYTHSH